MNKETIYLDHAAATPVDPKVRAAMEPYFSDAFYNPSAPYAPALAVRRDYEQAKRVIGHAIGAQGDDIIMTAGATESINIAFMSAEGHIVSSVIEHHAVLETIKRYDHTLVSADEKGMVSEDAIRSAIRPDTRLVSIALANNEIGTVQPLRRIAEVIKEERVRRQRVGDSTPIFLHSDASQGVGQLDVHVSRLGVDLLTLNAAKIYGPKQVGLLWVSSSVTLKPFLYGGGQEKGIRSGTENVAGTVGFAKAIELATEHRAFESERLRELRDSMQRTLVGAISDAVVSGHQKHRLSGHLHISFPFIDAERLLFMLEAKGIYIATGSACAANKGTRSHVLEAIGLLPEVADGSVRITLGHSSSKESCERASEEIIQAVRSEYERMAKL